MKRAIASAVGLVAFVGACATHPGGDAQGPSELQSGDVLPLSRVRFYRSGVGYFERQGPLGERRRALPVPAGHLDDALKSIVLLDRAGVASVSFPSRLSPAVARSRAGLPADTETALSYDRLLAALRGERVELVYRGQAGRAETSIRGRVVEVVAMGPDHPAYDHRPSVGSVPKGHTKLEEPERLYVLLLSEEGEILQLDSAMLRSVRPLDDAIAARLEAALSARLASRSGRPGPLWLTPSADARRVVRLGYLAEAPTWRPSYRLIFGTPPSGKKEAPDTALQGWALVHNDTDEAWARVAVELVDGRPSSFLFPMAAPRYERRDLETPERVLSSVPQLSTTTPDAMWGDFSDYAGEPVVRLGVTGTGEGGGGQGFGTGSGRLGGSHRVRAASTRRGASVAGSDLVWFGDLAARSGFTPDVGHATSVFRVREALSLLPQHSAMVPFLDARVPAHPIVWFGHVSAEPERAVGVENTTAYVFPEGPLAVFGEGGFLGEAVLQRLKPGGRQFARIGDETEVDMQSSAMAPELEHRHVDLRFGQLRTHSIRTTRTRFWFENRSGRPRDTYVGLAVVRNAALDGADRVDYESTSDTPLAVFELQKGRSGPREIVVREAISQGTPLEEITEAELAEARASAQLPDEERRILERAEQRARDRDVTRRAARELDAELDAVEADLERLKEHADALTRKEAGGGDALSALVGRILERDDRLRELQTRRRALDKELGARDVALTEVLEAFDALRPRLLEEWERARKSALGG
jgi:hypothetical protein